MTESKIRDYFNGLISASDLKNVKAVGEILPYYKQVDSITEVNFEITIEHLDKMCDDVLTNNLSSEHLDTISFILIGSDYSDWNSEAKDGGKISEVLFEWNNPNINYPLNIPNVLEWKNYLNGQTRKMNEQQ